MKIIIFNALDDAEVGGRWFSLYILKTSVHPETRPSPPFQGPKKAGENPGKEQGSFCDYPKDT